MFTFWVFFVSVYCFGGVIECWTTILLQKEMGAKKKQEGRKHRGT